MHVPEYTFEQELRPFLPARGTRSMEGTKVHKSWSVAKCSLSCQSLSFLSQFQRPLKVEEYFWIIAQFYNRVEKNFQNFQNCSHRSSIFSFIKYHLFRQKTILISFELVQIKCLVGADDVTKISVRVGSKNRN